MNKRKLRLDKYGISSKRYKELCGFCEQYPEWKQELLKNPVIQGVKYDDMPHAPSSDGDTTSRLAFKRIDWERKCTLVEETAKQASSDLWKSLIDNICYEVPIRYLIEVKNAPISERAFYDLRRYFFYLLDKNKQM